jgi:predicted CXXCH cytochrome family protein
MGAQVINLGFGGTGSSELLQNAVNYALARGVTVVAAAGNAGSSTIQFPAGYPGVLAVSAVDNSMYWAPFSSNGDHISLAAPGVNVYSTALNGQYSASSGTSLSAAHVSGVAALLAGQPAFANPNVLRSALLNTTINPNNNDFDQYFGYGVVQAYSALSYAGTILPTPTPWVVPTATPGGPGGVRIMATEDLWGLTQTSTYAQVNPANSIDSAFNDLVASSTGAYGAAAARNWTYTDIGDTTLTTIAAAYLDFRFYMTGWVNDTYYIDVYEPTNPFCGAFGWCRVATLQYTLVPANPTIIQPPSTLTTFTIPVGSILNTVSKVNNARVRITGSGITLDGAEIVTIHIDEIRLQVMDELPPTPTPSPTPVFIPTSTVPTGRAPTAMPDPNEPHSNFSPTTDQCGTCHRSHTAQGQQLRSTAAEEETCFSCHTGGGTGTNVQPAFTSRTNTLTRIFNHAVSATSNIHRSEEIVGFNFSGPNRHIECEDCHSPHSSARSAVPGANAAPSIQQEMFHSTGAMPEWTAPGAPTSFTWLSQSTREFEVCMKCHSSFTTLPTYAPDGFGWDGSSPIAGYISNGLNKLTSTNPAQVLDSRDMAKEFNSYQVSFHPVAALGRNTNMPAGSFVAPWSQNSILYCTDCHDYSAGSSDGPHGSALLHILDGTADYITKTDPLASCAPGGCPSIHNPGELCFKCHQYNTYATGMNPVTTTNFRTGTANMHAFHSFGSCYSCHDSHGSEQDRLINFDTAVVGVDLGYTSQSAWQFNGATGTGTCYISCHSGDHGADTSRQYTP